MYIAAGVKNKDIEKINNSVGLYYNHITNLYNWDARALDYSLPFVLYVNLHEYKHKLSFNKLVKLFSIEKTFALIDKYKYLVSLYGLPCRYIISCDYDNKDPYIYDIEAEFHMYDDSGVNKYDEELGAFTHDIIHTCNLSITIDNKIYMKDIAELSSDTIDKNEQVTIKIGNCEICSEEYKGPGHYVGQDPCDDMTFF